MKSASFSAAARERGAAVLSDPLLASARLRRAVRSASSRVINRLRPRVAGDSGANRNRPILDYRRELNQAPIGRALLSYLAEPFHHPPEYSRGRDYSNWMMALEIANALNRLGYVVDVINYDDYEFQPTAQYDVFAGMAANFSRLLPLLPASVKAVYWATRPDPAFELEAIRQRQLALYQRRHQWLPIPDAIMPLLESADYHRADALILIGNDRIRASFRTATSHVYCVDNPALPLAPVTQARDWSSARKHFLFLASWLLVRKGLDVVLEAFAARPGIDVWICGPVDSEPAFLKTYRQELFYTPNIHTVGWVEMSSPAFTQVASRCGFLVFPSCAEGMSGSVINGMASGLIPICTPETGVDLDDFGIPITDPSPNALRALLDEAASLPVAELQRRGEAARTAATRRYTIANFREQIEGALRNALPRP